MQWRERLEIVGKGLLGSVALGCGTVGYEGYGIVGIVKGGNYPEHVDRASHSPRQAYDPRHLRGSP